ncbi:YjbQ family protein [Candidatus Micrarchaeota archaeon]|nr:YjbQ family protein [Candidatus Micrarchaeota archaeon]
MRLRPSWVSGLNSEFFVETKKRVEVIDITAEVEKRAGSGNACLVFVPHATAALILNEFEPNIQEDYGEFFSRIAKGEWKHDRIDNNAEAHLLSALISPSVLVPVENKRLQLGTWQRIMLVELDGPRKRKVLVRMI